MDRITHWSALAALVISLFAGPNAVQAQADPPVEGRRHMNITVGVPLVFDSGDDYDMGPGVEITGRIGYQVEILVIEGHAGFATWKQGASEPGFPARRVTGPFMGFGGRLRFPVSEVFLPYVMAGLRLSWWGVEGASLKFAPTLVSQIGAEVHFGGAKQWMIHFGVENHVYMPGKAFENRSWSLGPFTGLGFIF